MADTIDSISIELTASTESAENSIQRVIDMLRMLKAATIDASVESRIGKSIRSIAKAAKEVDTDAGQRLARLAGGLKALSKVGDLSNLTDAGKNLSGVVRAVNSMGQSGGKGLSNLASGIKQTSDALGSIKDADVSKLGAVRDALSGEMSGSLHQASQNVIEHPALGGSVAQNYDLGLVNPGAVSIYERIAQAIGEATAAHREFREEVGNGGGIAGLLGDGAVVGAIAVFNRVADSIRDATSAIRQLKGETNGWTWGNENTGVDWASAWAARQPKALNAGQDFTFGGSGLDQASAIEIELRDLGESADYAAERFANFKMTPLEDEFAKASGAAMNFGQAIEYTGYTFSKFNSIAWTAGNAISHIGSGFSGVGSMLGMFGNAAGQAGSVFMQFTGIAGFAKDILYGIGNDADTASKKMGGLAKMAQNVGGAFSRYGFAAIPKYFGGQLIGNIQKATKGLTGFFHSIVRIAKYRLIRTALRMITQGINEGLKNLYAWSNAADGTFAKSMDTIATASKYAGNSIAAMASPLINALAPAIDFIADKFVDLFNLINQIMSRLSGKTSYTAAKKVAAQWQDVGQAVDEMKRTVLGFDQINKLNSASAGGSGAGGSGTDGSSMFETRPITGSVSSFADELKAAFDASNWQQLGTLIGEKLNDIIDDIDFAGIGSKIGSYINGWFSTKYWTLDTINFTNIGSKIAEFLNNAISEIDFSTIGATLVQKLTIIGDLIIGFFTNFDWGQAASSFSDFVKGIYNEISKWLDKYDWGDIGNTIYTKLKDALTNLDLGGIASSFVTMLGKAIKAVVSAGAGFIAGFWADVTAYWDEHIKADDFTTTVHNILDAIGQGFSNLGAWVWNNVVNPFIVALTGDENWDKNLLEFGGKIWETIKTGVTNAVQGVGSWIQKYIFKPFVDAWHWLLGIFGGGDDEGNFTTNASGVGEQVIEETDTETMRQLKALGASMGDAIKTGLLERMSGISDSIWKTINDNWSIKDRKLDVTISSTPDANSVWTEFLTAWGTKTLTIYIGTNVTAGELFSLFEQAWNDAGSKTLYFSPKLDNTAKVLYDGFISAWNNAGSKTLYLSPKLDNSAAVLYANFKTEWDAQGSKVLYFSPKLDNGANTLYTNFKSEWDSSGSKTLYFSPKLDNTAKVLYDGFIKDWNDAGSKTLYFSPKLDNTAKTLYNGFISDWNNAGSKTLYLSPKLDNSGSALWNTLKGDWDKSVTGLYASPKLDNTGSTLWTGFKKEWDSAAKELTIKVKLEYDDSGFGGATGGGGSTSGGGAGRSISIPIAEPTQKEVQSYWDSLLGYWNSIYQSGKSGFKLLISGLDSNSVNGYWNSLKSTWDAGVVAAQKGLNVIIKPIQSAGQSLSTVFTNIGQWLFGRSDTPYTPVGIVGNLCAGAGFAQVNNDGTLTLTGVNPALALVNGVPGAGFKSTLSGTNKYTLKGVEDATAKIGYVSALESEGRTFQSWFNWTEGNSPNNPIVDTDVDLKKTSKWQENANGAIGYLGLTKLSTKTTVNLKKGWGKDDPIKKLGIDDLKTTVTAEIKLKKKTFQMEATFGGGGSGKGTLSLQEQALGGVYQNGVWSSIPQYAGGTTNAHGSLFLAGEAGPEIVGHVGGRTEVLNRSQLAATMYSAVRSAMSGVQIAATMYSGNIGNDDADYEMMYRAMYDAFSAAMAGSTERDREKVALLRQISEKEFRADISTSDINRAQTRANRRAGITVVPVGT